MIHRSTSLKCVDWRRVPPSVTNCPGRNLRLPDGDQSRHGMVHLKGLEPSQTRVRAEASAARCSRCVVVGTTGIEPAISGMKARCLASLAMSPLVSLDGADPSTSCTSSRCSAVELQGCW